ncbi:MAG TPA: hypothetical protein VFN89_03370 [Solirubrobacterales bacterium]|nr:hypothetical protein [Solirubrobacterales bacterium]
MIAVGAAALVAAVALASATRQVFAVALFRYATDAPVGGFAEADLRYPFSLAKKTRRTRLWAWIALGLIVRDIPTCACCRVEAERQAMALLEARSQNVQQRVGRSARA